MDKYAYHNSDEQINRAYKLLAELRKDRKSAQAFLRKNKRMIDKLENSLKAMAKAQAQFRAAEFDASCMVSNPV